MILSVDEVEGFKSLLPALLAEPAKTDVFMSVFDWFKGFDATVSQFGDLFYHAWGEGFFTAPASTRFHGTFEGGLVAHSVGVLQRTLDLMGAFGFDGEVTSSWFLGLVTAALYHDLCKAGLYTVDFRNVKNDRGVWNKEPYYRVKEGSTGIGHGAESLRRISKFVRLPYEWELAVAWHMGSYGLTSEENIQYMSCCRKFREVLLLHTADMLQVSSGGA